MGLVFITLLIFLIISAKAEVDPAPNWQSFALLDYLYSSCVQDDPHACWGLGHCGADGKCICNVGWRGPTCAQLDLAPAKKASFGLPMNGSFPTWGGSGFMQDGKWQFLAGAKFLQDPMSTRAISDGVVFSEEEGAALILPTLTL